MRRFKSEISGGGGGLNYGWAAQEGLGWGGGMGGRFGVRGVINPKKKEKYRI